MKLFIKKAAANPSPCNKAPVVSFSLRPLVGELVDKGHAEDYDEGI